MQISAQLRSALDQTPMEVDLSWATETPAPGTDAAKAFAACVVDLSRLNEDMRSLIDSGKKTTYIVGDSEVILRAAYERLDTVTKRLWAAVSTLEQLGHAKGAAAVRNTAGAWGRLTFAHFKELREAEDAKAKEARSHGESLIDQTAEKRYWDRPGTGGRTICIDPGETQRTVQCNACLGLKDQYLHGTALVYVSLPLGQLEGSARCARGIHEYRVIRR
jgi:hypothetical protein